MARKPSPRELEFTAGARLEISKLLIGGAISIVLAIITSWVTLRTASGDLHVARAQVDSATKKLSSAEQQVNSATVIAQSAQEAGTPVGTIVASIMPWEAFSNASGRSAAFDESSSLWSPCDGRSIAGSRAQEEYGLREAPDLRGVFLRGLNVQAPGVAPPLDDSRADPDFGRAAGSFQADDFRSHTHDLGYGRWGLKNGEQNLNLEASIHPTVTTAAAGGKETRPKNVAVYYYIRIN
jgi:hypothetical protein